MTKPRSVDAQGGTGVRVMAVRVASAVCVLVCTIGLTKADTGSVATRACAHEQGKAITPTLDSGCNADLN